ncbi:hypothetical protein Agub_g9467 [Astrephomene gubernaculifera]|uniref:Uncharacterized protein n=1 Tax=Astrephomene gubernaculifera TaxID=47775 RepID=A0AAD3DTS6_9CHLO|nr:hypothetical protein Agub_g9467 [Astrephomene gubernaculifera]
MLSDLFVKVGLSRPFNAIQLCAGARRLSNTLPSYVYTYSQQSLATMKGISFKTRMNRLWGAYERQLSRHPVATQMATSCVLWGAGDILAQRVVERRRWDKIDNRRVAATAAFGASFMGPVGHFWYHQLDQICSRLLRSGTPAFLAAKLIADTAVMGPLYVVAFYAWGSAFIDRTGFEGFRTKIVKDFLPTFTAELAVWPLFQAFNFTRIPVEHQLLAVNAMTLVDACFLSWARAQEDWVSEAMGAFASWNGSRSSSSCDPQQPALTNLQKQGEQQRR